jgi:hypothetical protein
MLAELTADGSIVPERRQVGPYHQHRFAPLTAEIDTSVFSPAELETIEDVVATWGVGVPSAVIERESHDDEPWSVTPLYSDISYMQAFHRHRCARPSPRERDQMVRAVVSSQAIEGVQVSLEDAAAALDAVLSRPCRELAIG